MSFHVLDCLTDGIPCFCPRSQYDCNISEWIFTAGHLGKAITLIQQVVFDSVESLPRSILGISVTELAGKPSHQISLSGQWWASWQTSRSGVDKIATQQVEIKQEGDLLQVATVTRGLSEEEGGYHWSGELRLWDNELLMGWYASTDGSIRSKGTMYFVLHPHGLNMAGRWVGLGFDDRIMTGWASMGQTREQSEDAMASLIETEGVARADGPAL